MSVLSMPIDQVFEKYPRLPHKFLIKFAVECAYDIKHLLTDPKSLNALEVTELWLQDKITTEELRAIADDAYDSNNFTNIYADSAIYAAVAAAYVDFVDVYIIYSVYCVSKALDVPEGKYSAKLLKMIDELTDLEKLVYLR